MLSARFVTVLGAASALAAVLSVPLPAHATIVTAIDEFVITRSGITNPGLGAYEGQNVFYRDSFNDGSVPPSGAVFFNGSPGNYALLGTYPAGAEFGGKLTIDSSLGGPFINSGGLGRTLQRSTLPTDTDPTSQAGLKESFHTFSVYGLFDLAIPPLPADGYGILLNDAGPSLTSTESLDLFVRRELNNTVVIRFQEQDFLNGTINTLDLDSLSAPLGADQIELRMQRGATGTAVVTAAYRFWLNGAPAGSGAFTEMTGTADFFTNRGWARAGFFAVQAVPEPGTIALLLIGALPLVMQARRRRSD